MPHTRHTITRLSFRLACAGAGCAVALLAGCSGGGDGGGSGGGESQGILAVFFPTVPDPNSPLTPFERQRMIARIQQDPNQVSRLSDRERRDLAAIASALKKKKEKDSE